MNCTRKKEVPSNPVRNVKTYTSKPKQQRDKARTINERNDRLHHTASSTHHQNDICQNPTAKKRETVHSDHGEKTTDSHLAQEGIFPRDRTAYASRHSILRPGHMQLPYYDVLRDSCYVYVQPTRVARQWLWSGRRTCKQNAKA